MYYDHEEEPGSSDSSRLGLRRSTHHSSSFKDSKNKRKTTSLPQETVDYLKNWMMSPEHIAHPYPTEQEKADIMADTGIELKQLTNWFVNNRKRFWKPQVEAKMREQQPSPKSKSSSEESLRSLVSEGVFPTTRVPSQLSLAGHTSLPSVVSPARGATVSEQSSSSASSDDDDDEESIDSVDENNHSCCPTPDQRTAETTTKSEPCMLYILQPELGDLPSMEDVTTRCSKASSGIILQQMKCDISYVIPSDASYKKAQSNRRAEIESLKRYHLEEYLMQRQHVVSAKRSRASIEEELPTPRPKYRRVSIDIWKEACLTARDGYDRSLPSLDEAANLFGFAQV